MRTLELETKDMEALRVACSFMEGCEIRRIDKCKMIGDDKGVAYSTAFAARYRELWNRLYRLQYNTEPPVLSDGVTAMALERLRI